MNKGKIIFLNGVSSSGKTTLTRVLQNKLDEPYYWLSLDAFFNMSAEKFCNNDWAETEYQAISLLNNTIKLFSDLGKNVIVDHVMLSVQKGEILRECVDLLYDYPVLFVHVTCSSIDELRRREKARGDRNIGQAEEQITLLVPQATYDIIVDTYANTTEECADKIINLLNDTDSVRTFKKLHEGGKVFWR